MAKFLAVFDGTEREIFNFNITRNTPLPNETAVRINLTDNIAINTVFMFGAGATALHSDSGFHRHYFPSGINRITIF